MEIIKGEKPPAPESLSIEARDEMSRFENLKFEARVAARRVSNFKLLCDHIVFQRTYKNDVWEHNPDGLAGASCLICKRNFGWACPDSKDGACHYPYEIAEDGGTITLNDRSQVTPEEPEGGFWNESCVFCGHPEERK